VTAVELIVSTPNGEALRRNNYNRQVWAPALKAAGVASGRDNGIHALRHYYASVLLDAGNNIKALSEYLGHSDAGFTLRTCTHLMPASAERTRKAVDDAFSCYNAITSLSG
jgi:integrase